MQHLAAKEAAEAAPPPYVYRAIGGGVMSPAGEEVA